jgi:hypothetical protein
MKKFTQILFCLVAFSNFGKAQTTIFLETFGTTKTGRDNCTSVTVPGTAEAGKYDPQKNELYSDHDWSSDSHVWNDGVSYSQTSAASTNPGACDDSGTTLNIRTNNASTYTGASGNGNLYFNANILNSFSISGINTTNYENVTLSFGIYGKNKADVTLLNLQCNTGDGYYDIATTQISSLLTTKATWLTVSGISLPASSALSLKFATPTTNSANSSAPVELRIDDIMVTGTQIVSGVNNLNENGRKVFVTNSGISFKGFSNGTVQIFNDLGMLVFTSEVKEILQPNLPKGLYILKINNFTQKINL